jgi:hypothetical protein
MTHQELLAMAAEISVDETLRFESTRDITHEESCELIYLKSVVENTFLSVPAMISVSILIFTSEITTHSDWPLRRGRP